MTATITTAITTMAMIFLLEEALGVPGGGGGIS